MSDTAFAIISTPDPSSATVFKRLMAAKGTDITRRSYAMDLRNFAAFLEIPRVGDQHPLTQVPDTSWQQLDTTHIAAYLEHLKKSVSPKTTRPYSTATIARRMTAVREFLTEAAYLGLFPREKLSYLKDRLSTPEVTHEHHAGIAPDEQKQLLELAMKQPGLKGLRDYALFRLWLDTGLRREEMASLKVEDLTVKQGIPTLVVRRGKRGRLREIGLESYTAYVIKEWLTASGQLDHPDRPMFCQLRKVGRKDDATYGPVEPDKHLTGMALYKAVRWYCQKASIDSDITPHSFRVSFTTDALAGGAPIQHLQAAGGWTTSAMITQVYDRNRYLEPVARYRKTILPQRQSLTAYVETEYAKMQEKR
ncbi:MAG: tyrosine-type recombinase/integrase [Anaerolineae bacterium]|nr:tyrosine-type recombinase/integrase [Anaerolineae bacterium]